MAALAGRPLRIGTRGSALAMAQAAEVGRRFEAGLGVAPELVQISTLGDRSSGRLADLGGQGAFVSAVRDAVAGEVVDVAVHSLKDLPTEPDARLAVAAIPVREDPRDALVARGGLSLGELPAGSRIGTGSPRRAAQLHALGLGFDVVEIRGNVDTRLKMVADGSIDAVVVARAGLLRLGRAADATEVLDPLQMLPAPGQGALAIEVSAHAEELRALAARLIDDIDTRAAVTAERALLAELEAGCSAPVGALAEVAAGDEGPELWLRGIVLAVDGSGFVRLSATGPPGDAEGLGRRLARDLLAEGAAGLAREPVG